MLINVVRGDMSLVGPPRRRITDIDQFGPAPLTAKPGISSWTALASEGYLPLDEAERRDARADSWRFAEYFGLLARTVIAVLFRR